MRASVKHVLHGLFVASAVAFATVGAVTPGYARGGGGGGGHGGGGGAFVGGGGGFHGGGFGFNGSSFGVNHSGSGFLGGDRGFEAHVFSAARPSDPAGNGRRRGNGMYGGCGLHPSVCNNWYVATPKPPYCPDY